MEGDRPHHFIRPKKDVLIVQKAVIEPQFNARGDFAQVEAEPLGPFDVAGFGPIAGILGRVLAPRVITEVGHLDAIAFQDDGRGTEVETEIGTRFRRGLAIVYPVCILQLAVLV